jgi:tetratricopeptide (TPR) repeat protein
MKLIATICVSLLLLSIPVFAEEHHHDHADVGEVHFTVSCNDQAKADFEHSVALLHDFWYAESEKAFQKVATGDPTCAMAYWGIAMSNYHPVWAPPNPQEMERGKAAAAKATSMDAKTDRERGYINAIAVFYKDTDTVNHKTRAKNYADAMAKVHEQNPDDMEASIFYALALLGTADITDKTFAVQKEAAAILTPLVSKAPTHPGIAHYIIHSYDYPGLAELALPAARAYAEIAPESPHALHMPSHIFTRLGLWDESIKSNLASSAKARAHVRETIPDGDSFDELHAMDYLEYAYLQLGDEQKAKEVMQQAAAVKKLDQNQFAAAYALAAIPARYAIERHDWKAAASLEVKPDWFPWDHFPYAEAITHYAVGIGAARSNDLEKAKKAEERLSVIQKALSAQDPYWAKQVEIQRQSVAAWITFAEGKKEDALVQMRAAAALEDTTEKHAVTPGAIVPAHELAGEMMIEMGQKDQAAAEFKKSLTTAPKRRNALAHL